MKDQLSNDLASLRIAREEPERARTSSGGSGAWWKWLVAVALVGGLAVGVKVFVVPYAQQKLFKTEVTLTEVALVSPAQASIQLTATGYVVPQIVAKVGAKITGRVTKVNVREGGTVKAGDILFELDPIDQKSEIASAKAKVMAARAKAAAARGKAQVARANLAQTKVTYDRDKQLAESGAIPGANVDDDEAKMKSLASQVSASDEDASAADADASAAQAEADMLTTNLGNFTIPSPIDGTAVVKPVEVGDVVDPARELVELVDFSSLLVEVDVPEARLGGIKKQAPCEVVFDAYASERMACAVVEISPRLNRAKATGTVKVKLVSAAETILPEMAARVSFLEKALDEKALSEKPKKVIPASAVIDRNGAKVAFVFEDGKAKMRTVQLGAPFAGGFELLDDLAPGTRLIASPAANLADGQPVKEKGGD